MAFRVLVRVWFLTFIGLVGVVAAITAAQNNSSATALLEKMETPEGYCDNHEGQGAIFCRHSGDRIYAQILITPGPYPGPSSPGSSPEPSSSGAGKSLLNPISPVPPPLVQPPVGAPPVLFLPTITSSLANNNSSQVISLLEQKNTQSFLAYFGRPLDVPELSSKKIQAILQEQALQTGKKPAVIYVLSRPNQTDLLAITPQGDPLYRAVGGVGQDRLLKMAETFTNLVRDPRLVNTRAYLPAAQQLYQWLIAPLRAGLEAQQIDTLVFIPDNGLRGIPLAALHDGQNFLVERFSVGLVPSMSLTDTRYVNIKEARILAMGASDFPDQSPLPAVPVELQQVAQDLGGGAVFLNEAFTLANFKKQHRQGTYGVIHLATHGEFRPGAPQNSYIAFRDSRLNLIQLRNLRLYRPPIELLTLSACRTAVGDLDAELGFAGLAVQAGVKSAVASLWYVSDEGTLALMTRFYKHLNTAPIKAEALRQAQLEMLRGEVTVKGNQLQTPQGEIPLPPEVAKGRGDRPLSHPYYWAAFTMIGNPW